MGMIAFVSGLLAGLTDCFSGIVSIPRLDGAILERWEHQRRKSMGALARRRQPEEPSDEERKRKSLIHKLKSGWSINFIYVFVTIVFFSYGILPLLVFVGGLLSEDFVKIIQDRIMPVLMTIFKGLWVIPLLVIMEIINTKFYMEISALVFIVHRHKTDKERPSLSWLCADRVFSLTVLTVFMLQTRLIRLVPFGYFVEASYVLHLSQLYAFYAFEYRWCFEGRNFQERLTAMEAHWNYFLGFGLPLAILTWLSPNWAMSAFIMYMVFPLYIISSQQAKRYRDNPMTTPLRLFRPSVFVANALFEVTCSWLTRRQPRR